MDREAGFNPNLSMVETDLRALTTCCIFENGLAGEMEKEWDKEDQGSSSEDRRRWKGRVCYFSLLLAVCNGWRDGKRGEYKGPHRC